MNDFFQALGACSEEFPHMPKTQFISWALSFKDDRQFTNALLMVGGQFHGRFLRDAAESVTVFGEKMPAALAATEVVDALETIFKEVIPDDPLLLAVTLVQFTGFERVEVEVKKETDMIILSEFAADIAKTAEGLEAQYNVLKGFGPNEGTLFLSQLAEKTRRLEEIFTSELAARAEGKDDE